MEEVLCGSNSRRTRTLGNYRLVLPLMSTSTGTCYDEAISASTVLAAAVNDILSESLNIQKVIDGCKDSLAASGCHKCNITSLGPNKTEGIILNALNSVTGTEVTCNLSKLTLDDLSVIKEIPSTSRKPKLAIVGMAGRFPDAADHEKFWDLLEAGLDVHRRVRTPLVPLMLIVLTVERSLKIDSMLRSTMTPQGKSGTPAILPMGVSLMNLVFLTHVSSTCHPAKLRKLIPCIDWVLQAHMKPLRWQATSPTEHPPQSLKGLVLSTARPAMIGEKSTKPRISIHISSLPEFELSHQ